MPDLPPMTQKKCLRLLRETCGYHAFLPRALQITACYDQTSNAVYKGGFADVWKGEHQGQGVAVKVIRTYSDDELQKIINVGHSISACYVIYDVLCRASAKRL